MTANCLFRGFAKDIPSCSVDRGTKPANNELCLFRGFSARSLFCVGVDDVPLAIIAPSSSSVINNTLPSSIFYPALLFSLALCVLSSSDSSPLAIIIMSHYFARFCAFSVLSSCKALSLDSFFRAPIIYHLACVFVASFNRLSSSKAVQSTIVWRNRENEAQAQRVEDFVINFMWFSRCCHPPPRLEETHRTHNNNISRLLRLKETSR